MINELNEIEVNEIKDFAREKLELCRKGNDIIGTQIFSILSLYARVIYYPLGEDAPWGFTRISGSQNDALLENHLWLLILPYRLIVRYLLPLTSCIIFGMNKIQMFCQLIC